MGSLTTTTSANFIPELWLDEVKAAYEANLKMGNTIKKFRHNGKAGDILHIPDISNLTATDVGADGYVAPQSVTESETQVTINQWKGVRIDIPDLLKIQSQYNLRSEYTSKMSYAVELAIEDALMALGVAATVQGYDADGTAATAGGADITAAGILRGVQFLDDNDVPPENRYLAVAPVTKNDMLQISQFTSGDYVNGKPTVKGEFGMIFNMAVYASTRMPTDSNSKKNALVYHRDWCVLAMQKSPSIKAAEATSAGYLATRIILDTVYGVKAYRDTTNIARLVTQD